MKLLIWEVTNNIDWDLSHHLGSYTKMVEVGSKSIDLMEKQIKLDLEKWYPNKVFDDPDEEMAYSSEESSVAYLEYTALENFIDVYWKGLLVSQISLLERILNDICETIDSYFLPYPLLTQNLKSGVVKDRHRFLLNNIALTSSDFSKTYNQFHDAIKLRNSIVHAGGIMDDEIRKIKLMEETFVIDKTKKQEYFRMHDGRYSLSLTPIIRQYFKEILEALDAKYIAAGFPEKPLREL